MALTKLKSSGIADGAVTASDIAANSITVAQLARAGTSGQLLTSAGTGADAGWSDAPAGGIQASEIKGWRIRPVFNRTAATTVKLCGTFAYQHAGTTTQILTGADVTFTRSDTSGTDQFNYLYIDDSAVVTAGNSAITASELISSPTAPTLNTTKGGFYNGNDRCIYAWRQNTSNDIYHFSPLSPYSVDGVVVSDFAWQFVNSSGNWGTGWKDYTVSTDYLPRPCGHSGLAVGVYIDLGGSHADMRIGNAGNHYDMYLVDSPWDQCAPVDDTGKFSVRLNYAHSSYTQIFYTRGWVMSPLL